jgi:hypothetical protein
MGRVEVGSQTFRGSVEWRKFFFRTNRFFFDKKSLFVQKIDTNFFWKLRNQYFILTSFIECKKLQHFIWRVSYSKTLNILKYIHLYFAYLFIMKLLAWCSLTPKKKPFLLTLDVLTH